MDAFISPPVSCSVCTNAPPVVYSSRYTGAEEGREERGEFPLPTRTAKRFPGVKGVEGVEVLDEEGTAAIPRKAEFLGGKRMGAEEFSHVHAAVLVEEHPGGVVVSKRYTPPLDTTQSRLGTEGRYASPREGALPGRGVLADLKKGKVAPGLARALKLTPVKYSAIQTYSVKYGKME